MCTIKVAPLLHETKDYREAGERLFPLMEQYYKSGVPFKLDMTDVGAIPSLLLNPCVGRFIDLYGVDELRKYLSFARILKSQAQRFIDYIQHYEPHKA